MDNNKKEFVKRCMLAGIPIKKASDMYSTAMGKITPGKTPIKAKPGKLVPPKIVKPPKLDYTKEMAKKSAFEFGVRDAIGFLLNGS